MKHQSCCNSRGQRHQPSRWQHLDHECVTGWGWSRSWGLKERPVEGHNPLHSGLAPVLHGLVGLYNAGRGPENMPCHYSEKCNGGAQMAFDMWMARGGGCSERVATIQQGGIYDIMTSPGQVMERCVMLCLVFQRSAC